MTTSLTRWAGAGALALALSMATTAVQAQFGQPAYSNSYMQNGYGGQSGPGGYGAQGGWDQAPQEFREAQRQGFHDGIEGARKDFDNHRRPNVNNRDEYRHPNVPRDLRRDYRDGFQRGYNVAMQHLINPGDRDRDHDHDGDRR